MNVKNPLSSAKPPETKVAAGTGVVGLVAIFTQLMQTYAPGVHLPSQTTMLLIAASLVGIFGYLAPHTNVPQDVQTVENVVSEVENIVEHKQPAPVTPDPTNVTTLPVPDPAQVWGKQ